MSGIPDLTADDRAGRPYGLIGLTIGFVLILAAAIIVCVLAFAVAFAIAALALGWREALDRVTEMRVALISTDLRFLQAAGIVVSLLSYAALSAVVLAAARLRGGARWRDIIGWRPWHPFRASGLFWAVAAGTIGYSLGADEVVSRFYPPSKAWVTLPSTPFWACLFIGLAVLFAPVAEELLFRGWLYTGLRLKIGAWGANLVSAVLFALAHWENTHIYALAVFPVGIALGFIRERTGSLKASIAFHAVYNAAASALLVMGR